MLFDENEKAHPKVLDLFLQIFDEGTLTDAQGKKCDFRESVHFKPLGMETAREELGKLMEDFNTRLENVAVRRREEDTGGGTYLERPGARRASHVRVELTPSAEELILREGYSEQYGARNLERAVDRFLGMLIAEALLNGKIASGETIRLEGKDGNMRMVGKDES